MKIYSNVFDLTQPIARQVYVSPNSVYAFGIKIVKKGIPETDYQLKVFQNGVEIQPMSTIVDGFKLYQRTSPSTPTVTEYDVVYLKGSTVQHLDLVENTTNSTVFDIDQKGGALDLPIASTSVLGGIKVGKNLTIEADGTLNGQAASAEYTAGKGISITDGSISIDDTVALKTEIPTKTSDLTNDSNFATVSQIPTKVGQLQNDAGYVTSAQIPTKTSELENDSNFATVSQIPTNVGQLSNDVGYVTSNQIPTKTSELSNDSDFATVSQIPTTVGKLENDVGYIKQSDTRDTLVIETQDGRDYNILHDGEIVETTQNFSRILTLAKQGKIVLSYDFDGKPGRYYVQTIEDNAIRFTATVTIDNIVKTRSILLWPFGDDTVSFNAGEVQEIALKTEIPTNTSLFEGEYDDGTPFSMNVYTA